MATTVKDMILKLANKYKDATTLKNFLKVLKQFDLGIHKKTPSFWIRTEGIKFTATGEDAIPFKYLLHKVIDDFKTNDEFQKYDFITKTQTKEMITEKEKWANLKKERSKYDNKIKKDTKNKTEIVGTEKKQQNIIERYLRYTNTDDAFMEEHNLSIEQFMDIKFSDELIEKRNNYLEYGYQEAMYLVLNMLISEAKLTASELQNIRILRKGLVSQFGRVLSEASKNKKINSKKMESFTRQIKRLSDVSKDSLISLVDSLSKLIKKESSNPVINNILLQSGNKQLETTPMNELIEILDSDEELDE